MAALAGLSWHEGKLMAGLRAVARWQVRCRGRLRRPGRAPLFSGRQVGLGFLGPIREIPPGTRKLTGATEAAIGAI